MLVKLATALLCVAGWLLDKSAAKTRLQSPIFRISKAVEELRRTK